MKKYVALVAGRSSGIPIVECGGLVLGPADKLLVSAEIYDRLRQQYGGYLCRVGDGEKASLANGHFEVAAALLEGVGGKAVGNAREALAPGAPEQAVERVSSDKSMAGKTKAKKKG